MVKKLRRFEFNLWVGTIPWRREWQPTPVFLPGESMDKRSLAGYSPWGRKESDMTEQLTLSFTFQDLPVRKRGKEGESFSRGTEDIHFLRRSSETKS